LHNYSNDFTNLSISLIIKTKVNLFDGKRFEFVF